MFWTKCFTNKVSMIWKWPKHKPNIPYGMFPHYWWTIVSLVVIYFYLSSKNSLWMIVKLTAIVGTLYRLLQNHPNWSKGSEKIIGCQFFVNIDQKN